MVKNVVPEFYVEEGVGADERYTACAVFCNANYEKAPAFASLNHWVPAALKQELQDPEVHFQRAEGKAKLKMKKELKKLEQRKAECDGDDEAMASVDFHIEHVKKGFANFFTMQKELWQEQGLLCARVDGDGNCGVYMLMGLIQEVPLNKVTHPAQMAFREEIKRLWEQHAMLPMWQAVWRCLREKLGSNQPAATPQRKKPKALDEGFPFTPDNPTKRKRLLPQETSALAENDIK